MRSRTEPAAAGTAVPAPTVIQTPRGPIECAIAGDGPVLVALHGGMGGYDQSWLLARSLLPDLAGHRVVAVSRPGYLGTPLEVGPSPEEQADAYAGLLDALGVREAAVAAVSAGGPSALAFARRHLAKCRALVLVSACSGRLETRPEIKAGIRFMKFLGLVPGLAAFLRRRGERNPEAAARRAIPDPELRARTLAHPAAGPLLRALQASVMERLRDRLPGTLNDTALFAALPTGPVDLVAVPVLVVHGTADRVVPFAHAEAVARAAPQAELMAIAGGEHVALFTHLDEVRVRAERFLAKLCTEELSAADVVNISS